MNLTSYHSRRCPRCKRTARGVVLFSYTTYKEGTDLCFRWVPFTIVKGISNMEARFFRVRFNDNGKGVYHTLAYRDEIENLCVHLSYVSDGGDESWETTYPVDILVAADLREETLQKIERIAMSHQVDRLYLPKPEANHPAMEQIKNKVKSVHPVSEGEAVAWNEGLWKFWIGNLEGCLSLYHEYAGTKSLGENCVYAGRICGPEDLCSPCLMDDDRDYCGFGCIHQKDFHLLRAHQNSQYPGYRTGTLILGRTVFQGQAGRLLKMIPKVEEKIRVIQLPHQIERWDQEILRLMEADEIQYYIGNTELTSRIAGDIVLHSRYNQYIAAEGKYGLCLSGYFIPIQREKNY